MFGKRTLEQAYGRKQMDIWGVPFTLKPVNVLDYLDGSRVLVQVYDTYKTGTVSAEAVVSDKKIIEHMRDVIMAGVESPKLKRKKDANVEGFFVDDLFENAEFAATVYGEIMKLSYPQKKKMFGVFLERSLKKLTRWQSATASYQQSF